MNNKTPIDELYKIQKKDIEKACNVLGKAFHDDPAWIHVIPDENERKEKLPTIFEYIIRYSLKYGKVHAPTENLEGIAVWIPHTTVEKSIWRILRSGAFRAAIKMGSEIGSNIQKLFDQIDKDRREHMKDRPYLYLQAIGVLPEFQGQGIGGNLLKPMFANADLNGVSIYLETETEKNMQIYSKYGFKILKEGKAPGAEFHFWEMVREPNI
ncbi:MAG: GNAT family N-acetyltransferase [Candidatus Heimdallarchaeota archaeon]|nr:MAG: GNAT family N-acetyltransferase [Candidatus Heimdallarchaeota archaeon]